MALGSGELPLNSPTAADGRAGVAVMASSNHRLAAAKPMNPFLLASACFGSCQALTFLFSREDKQEPPTMMPTEAFLNMLKASDVEGGVDQTAMPAAPLLGGVTVEGDTALHVVATHGDGANYLESANVIYGRAKHLLFELNKNGDTPLHCAARAGNSKMVSHLIDLARAEDNSCERLKELLRKENGRKETALHEAVRIGNNPIVELLMTDDSELARFPKQGTSPLYLAILLEKNHIITQSLHDKAKGNLSYSGPNGQNALHAAVLRKKVFTEKLLRWNKGLTTERDQNGSTPLHFAAALLHRLYPGRVLSQVFKANPAALYQSDHHGLFPIHVAASVGAKATVAMFLKEYPSSAGLRDAKRRTFLHIAVRKKKQDIVRFACRTTSLSWILNMQDIDGNTALHLAVKTGDLLMFCYLFGNEAVHLNLTNDKGQTPLDISRYSIPPGMNYAMNTEVKIRDALNLARARHGGCRWDHFEEKFRAIDQLKSDLQRLKDKTQIDYESKELEKFKDTTQTDYGLRELERLNDTTQTDYESRELEKLKDTTQTLCIGSVIIVTMTFGATFALPGGYRADDHANGGTPTLAGRYAFDAFMMANTIALICSAIATLGLMYSGASMVNLLSRKFYFLTSVYFIACSVTSLTAAFALGAYMVLAPVAHRTAIAICVMSPLVVLYRDMEFWLKWALLAPPLRIRMGTIRALRMFATIFVSNMFFTFWPFIFIFIWPAYARGHPVSKMELSVQPSGPLT